MPQISLKLTDFTYIYAKNVMELGRYDKSNQFNTDRYMKRALLKLKSQYFYFKKLIVIIDFAIPMKMIIMRWHYLLKCMYNKL